MWDTVNPLPGSTAVVHMYQFISGIQRWVGSGIYIGQRQVKVLLHTAPTYYLLQHSLTACQRTEKRASFLEDGGMGSMRHWNPQPPQVLQTHAKHKHVEERKD